MLIERDDALTKRDIVPIGAVGGGGMWRVTTTALCWFADRVRISL